MADKSAASSAAADESAARFAVADMVAAGTEGFRRHQKAPSDRDRRMQKVRQQGPMAPRRQSVVREPRQHGQKATVQSEQDQQWRDE